MVNEEKVKIMNRLAMYEHGEGIYRLRLMSSTCDFSRFASFTSAI